MQDVTNTFSLPSFAVCMIFLSSLTLYKTTSFLTRSVQPSFSIIPTTTFQIFPGNSDLLSEVFKSQAKQTYDPV